MFERDSLDALLGALNTLESGFSALPAYSSAAVDRKRIGDVLTDVAHRLADNYPYFHPLYAGQMLKPPHPIARAAYALATWINPNNHALDGGRASSAMEKEAVAKLATMFGWSEHLGHLTGGGTMANMEALWVAGQLHPAKLIVASEQAHYTHERICSVFHQPFKKVGVDNRGRMDLQALEELLRTGEVGCVVATLGTTGIGSVDPLEEILQLRQKYSFRIHVDAAYGGYFCLVDNLAPEATRAFEFIGEADSIVVDPHKHGLQPYGCGCVLFRDTTVGRFYRHNSPYTYFSSNELHLGEISLECSRAGASAVALWATHRLLPLNRGGEFSSGLAASRRATLLLAEKLANDERFVVPFAPELDILVWGVKADSAEAASELAQRVFDEAATRNLHLALVRLPVRFLQERWPSLSDDAEHLLCLRSVLMKPEHERYVDGIYALLCEATAAALAGAR